MSNELATTGAAALSIVPAVDIRQVIAENIGPSISPSDLDRVKMPSGGSLAFEVPTLEGSDMVKTIEGIIIHHKDQNAYWSQSIEETGGGSPPDCASQDGRFGVGCPGGVCAKCALNQFGSDIDGEGKACKNTKVLFLLQPGKLLPMVIFMPPTSIPVVKKYMLQLTAAGLPFYGVKTQISLEKSKNKKNIEYSRAVIKPVAVNPEAAGNTRLLLPDIDGIRAYRDDIMPFLQSMQFDEAEAAGYDVPEESAE